MITYIMTIGCAKQEFIFKWIVREDRPFNLKARHVGEVVSFSCFLFLLFLFSPGPVNDETRKKKKFKSCLNLVTCTKRHLDT